MSPYLTARGRWLLLSGSVFLFMGALLSRPLILFMGEIQIALVALGFLLLVPSAVAVDRRRVRVEVDLDEDDADVTHLTGDPFTLGIRVINESGVTLHALRAQPFGAENLECEPLEEIQALPRRSATRASFVTRARLSGRWALHGFDVRVSDPLGLIESKDYLPCAHPMEFIPKMALPRRAPRSRALIRAEGGRHAVRRLGVGTEVRELRDHHPGDPLRHVAWKATVRRGKLISRNFEHEASRRAYVLLDISCSMRGGSPAGLKLEHGFEEVLAFARGALDGRDSVGMITFDEKVYGHVLPSASPGQLRKITRHLTGLSAVVDPELTELDDDEVHALLADYLLIQERLDFKKGDEVDPHTGVNTKLLKRWLSSVERDNLERYDTPALREGVVSLETSLARRFAQLRGVQLPYRVEARLGMKERGLVDALERVIATSKGRHEILVVTDLCGVMNLDLLSRGVRLAKLKGNTLRFLVPFTPAFYEPRLDSTRRYRVLKELFTSAERDERALIVDELRKLGVRVEMTHPRFA